MSMFCGLPVMVIALPTLDASAIASRNGRGRSRSGRSAEITSGVKTRQTVSLMKSADNTPLSATIAAKSARGDLMRSTMCAAAHSKNPPSSR